MIPKGNLQSNVDRFSGFENLYDKYRPEAPQLVVNIIMNYLQTTRLSKIVDVGCGTGLSSFIWKNHADRIVGIEPNPDMIGKARQKLQQYSGVRNISFVQGYSNQMDVESASADVLTCSQSFHWMEPASTLQEVSRVLRDGGIFAAYDYDWPPTLDWRIEDLFSKLMNKSNSLTSRIVDTDHQAKKWSKDEHLQNMKSSNAFRYVKEIVFHHTEKCDAERFIGLALSQGSLQTIFKTGAGDLQEDIENFKFAVESYFNGATLEIMFGYRMRLGVK